MRGRILFRPHSKAIGAAGIKIRVSIFVWPRSDSGAMGEILDIKSDARAAKGDV